MKLLELSVGCFRSTLKRKIPKVREEGITDLFINKIKVGNHQKNATFVKKTSSPSYPRNNFFHFPVYSLSIWVSVAERIKGLSENKYCVDCPTLVFWPRNLGFRKTLIATKFEIHFNRSFSSKSSIFPEVDEPEHVMRGTNGPNESSYPTSRASTKYAQKTQRLRI